MSDQQQYPQYQYPQFQEPVAPDGRVLAGQGQRLGARIIDTVVYLVAAPDDGGCAASSAVIT